MFSFSSPGEEEASGPEHVLTRSGKLVDGYLWKSTSDSSWERKEEQLEKACCVSLSSLRVFLTLSQKVEQRAHQCFTVQFFSCYKHLLRTSLCAWTADTLYIRTTARTSFPIQWHTIIDIVWSWSAHKLKLTLLATTSCTSPAVDRRMATASWCESPTREWLFIISNSSPAFRRPSLK